MPPYAVLNFAILAVCALSLLLWAVQPSYCSHCYHCRQLKHEEADRKAKQKAAYEEQHHIAMHKLYGFNNKTCPTCIKRG